MKGSYTLMNLAAYVAQQHSHVHGRTNAISFTSGSGPEIAWQRAFALVAAGGLMSDAANRRREEQMTGLSLRVHVLGVALATSLAMAMSLHAPYAHGQPLFQGSLACPGGVPTGEQVGHGLLGALVDPTLGNPLNSAWTGDSVQTKIEGDTYILNRQHVPNGCNSDVDRVCGFEGSSGSATCSFVYVDMTIKPSSSTSLDALRGLGQSC